MSLTDIKIRAAKPREKAYKLADEKGLYMLITPTNSRCWYLKYRFAGKEKKLAFGVYPEVTLAIARSKRDEARKLLGNNIDPGVEKQLNKRVKKLTMENSFEALTREWYIKYSNKWTPRHRERFFTRLEKDIFPWIGDRPINEITAPELLNAVRRIESRGAIETAHRALQNCGRVFRYAIATGRAVRDISSDLKGALQPINKQRHHASITDPKEIAKLLRTINSYEGYLVTKCALQLAPLIFVRPGELRHAEWAEIDFENAEWHIPAHKMKMRTKHIVPLSLQAIKILKELHPLTGAGKYVFPSVRTTQRPMSENTVVGALRRLGYTKDEMTGHGFRSMASTLLNEQGWNRDAIERQLAHTEHRIGQGMARALVRSHLLYYI